MSEPIEKWETDRLGLPLAPEVASLPLRILLVEDSTTMAEWVKHHIDPIREEFPHATIQIVHEWSEAREYIFSDPPPHVVCLDLILPGRTWEQSVDEVPAIEARSAVIIITGKNISDVRERLIDKEVEVIMKGPDIFERFFLIRAIVRSLQRWKAAKARKNIDEIKSIVSRLERRYATTPLETQ